MQEDPTLAEVPVTLPRFLTKGSDELFSLGHRIFKRGDAIGEGAVFYVVEGEVELCRVLAGNLGKFSFKAQAGDFFGATSTYGSDVRAFEATAVCDSKVYRWSRSEFDFILGVYQEAARHLIQSLSRRLRRANRLGAA